VKYRAFFQNGGYAEFEWEGDPTDVEQADDLLEAAYNEAPPGLCNHCAGNYDISEDVEVYEIQETESGNVVFKEPSWDERLRESAARATELNAKLTAEVIDTRTQRDNLAFILRKAGFTVDPDTYAVIRH
jgi:hypothetical protein